MTVLKFHMVSILLLISSLSHAGKLSDFEKDIIQSKKYKHEESRHHDGSGGDWFFDIIFEGILGGTENSNTKAGKRNDTPHTSDPNYLAELIEVGEKTSKQRISKYPHESGITKRKNGEIILPFYRFNLNTQHVDNQINGLDFKMEFGRGVHGFEVRTTKYRDDQDNEDLRYNQFQYFHRMSFGNKVGVNFGVGYASMDIVESFEGLIFSLPVLFQNGRHFGVEFRPSYFDADGVGINEMDISALYTYRKMAFRLGHRSIESPGVDIDGVYFGMDFIF